MLSRFFVVVLDEGGGRAGLESPPTQPMGRGTVIQGAGKSDNLNVMSGVLIYRRWVVLVVGSGVVAGVAWVEGWVVQMVQGSRTGSLGAVLSS